MNIKEAKDLLPFFVNGTLELSERKQVEELLKTSPELREELRFWQDAAAATRAVSSYEVSGHPPGEDIVDYALGRIDDAAKRLSVERHAQGCDSCRNEVELVRETSGESARPEVSLKKKVWHAVDQYKIRYVVPALAVATLVVLLINTEQQAHREKETTSPTKLPPTMPKSVEQIVMPGRSALLVLEHTTQLRGRQSAPSRIPLLRLDSVVTHADFALLIPKNQLRDIRYDIALLSASGKRIAAGKDYDVKSGPVVDTLAVSFPATTFGVKDGKYDIVVKEILPGRLSDLTPEEYRYPFATRISIAKR